MSFVKERFRTSFTVPAGAGSYAPEVMTFGVVPSTVIQDGLTGVTLLIETVGLATGAIFELWLPKVVGTTDTPPDISTGYFNSGLSITAGAETWALASYPGAQIRVKSAGVAGTAIANGSAD